MLKIKVKLPFNIFILQIFFFSIFNYEAKRDQLQETKIPPIQPNVYLKLH